MSDNTIIQQGYFTSTGVDKYIPLRSDADWVEVWNINNIAATPAAQPAAAHVCHWHWQREFTNAFSVIEYKAAGAHALYMATSIVGDGITANLPSVGVYDFGNQDAMLSGARAVTAGTNVVQPIVSTATTTGLSTGAIVRVTNTAMLNLNGLDFSIDTVVAATSFRLANAFGAAPGIAMGAAGFYRVVAPSLAAYKIFMPGNRVINNITAAANAVVTTLVDHGYAIGQQVKFKNVTGMTEINGLTGTIVAVPTAGTFTVDINTAGFTAFAFPLAAAIPTTFPQCIPTGDYSIPGFTTLQGATRNQSTLGILLPTSATPAIAMSSPGGQTGDLIKWVAGKSFAAFVP